MSATRGSSYSFFQNDPEFKKSAEFIRLLASCDIHSAVAFVLATPIHSENFTDSFSELCSSGEVTSDVLSSFLMSDFFITKEKWLLATIEKLITEQVGNNLSILTDDRIAELMVFLFKYDPNAEMLKGAAFASPLVTIQLLKYFESTAPGADRIALFTRLMGLAISLYNGRLLQGLADIEGGYADHWPKLCHFDPKQIRIYQFLRLLKTEAERDLVMNLMNQFAHGFGQINYEGGLLTLAQVQDRQSYPCYPVLLKYLSEVDEFIAQLKSQSGAAREIFILSELHWIAGDIQIKSDGSVSILILDAMGFNNRFEPFTMTLIEKFTREFPLAQIYYSNTKRQYGVGCCSVNALRDARKCISIDKSSDVYLEEKYKSTGIHGYIADSALKLATEAKDPLLTPATLETQAQATASLLLELDYENEALSVDVQVLPCELPLPFMTTMQTRKLFTNEIPSRSEAERKLPINKQGARLEDCEAKFFKASSLTSCLGGENKKVNVHLLKVLKKHEEYNLGFLEKTLNTVSDQKASEPVSFKDALEKAQSVFTMGAFRKRKCHEELTYSRVNRARVDGTSLSS
jgi:hypothetical protein